LIRVVLLFALSALLVSCASPVEPLVPDPVAVSGAPASKDKPVVRSLSWPVSWLVERLAGDLVDHECVVPVGEDPRAWKPSGELVNELLSADLIVANGAGYEVWTETASLASSRMVSASRGIGLIEHPGVVHSHGTGAHSHGETDPFLFLDPALFSRQAARVAAGLRTVTVDSAVIDERLATLQAELVVLGGEWDAVLKPLLASPPSGADKHWAYLFARVGAEMVHAAQSGHADHSEHADASPLFDIALLTSIERPATASYDYLAQSRAALAKLNGAAHD
jgi:zinc transport system substrate-binding protein